MALPKQNRLSLGKGKFFGKTCYAPFFSLVFVKNNSGKRFAFVVSNKRSKKATERNKIRRRLSESIKELLTRIKNGDYIFYAKNEIISKDFNKVKNALEKLLLRGGFLKSAKTHIASSQNIQNL